MAPSCSFRPESPHGLVNRGPEPLPLEAVFATTKIWLRYLERNPAPGTEADRRGPRLMTSGPARSRSATEMESIQHRLARRFDTRSFARIKRLWVRHSIAEDRRDIDGLIATLGPDCVYEIVPTGQHWKGHDGARAFYTELFAAFPDTPLP